MKLLTHNSLRCNLKGLKEDLPFELEVDEMEIVETEFNPNFIRHIMPILDWKGLKIAANAIKITDMPESYDSSMLTDEDFLKLVHHVLLDIIVINGTLICSETGTRFRIENQLPILT
jgi:multifunctional methyltransferase subunit TRM112